MADKLTIFHGSGQIIERPTFGLGNPHNDYGLGFYCTESAMRYLGKVVAFQRKISSRWFARDATGFRIAIGMRWIRSALRRNQRRR